MQHLQWVQGIDKLLEQLPEEYHHWHLFGNVLSFNFDKHFDCEKRFEEIACITMLLSDKEYKYIIKVRLNDVVGDIHFNIDNGFFSGLQMLDIKKNGYETDRRFIVSSFEMDSELSIECESVSVELLDN